MPDLCARVDGETVCVPLDLTVFTDPRQGAVPEPPGDAPGIIDITRGAPIVRTRLARGAAPDAWPRDQRIAAELVKGQERVPCEAMVLGPASRGNGDGGAEDLLLFGEEVFRAVLGREP